jgi:HlyD family secretion protein
MKYFQIIGLVGFLFIDSCNSNPTRYDASGNFEADEVIVSAQQTGELLSFDIHEGDSLQAGTFVGQIDVTMPTLQKEQTEARISALRKRTSTAINQNDLVKKRTGCSGNTVGPAVKGKRPGRKICSRQMPQHVSNWMISMR